MPRFRLISSLRYLRQRRSARGSASAPLRSAACFPLDPTAPRGPGGTAGAGPPPFWLIGIVAGFDSIAYAVVGPVLPALQRKAGASDLAASLIFAAFSIGLVAGFVLAGAGTRRFGPRLILLGGVVAHVAADVLFVVGSDPGVYAAARLFQGLGSGAVWIGAVFGALAWWPERPQRRLAGILLSYSVGYVGGPLLAALGGTVRPFAAEGVLGLGAGAAAVSLPTGGAPAFGWTASALKDRRLAFAAGVVLFAAFVYASLEGSFTLRFASQLSQTGLGALFALVAVATGVGALVPAATRGPRHGRVTAQLGMMGTAVLLVLVAASRDPIVWYVLLAAVGLLLGAAEAGALGLLATMPAAGMITAQVAYSQFWALGFLTAPPGATALAQTFGRLAPAIALAAAAAATTGLGFLVPATGGRERGP